MEIINGVDKVTINGDSKRNENSFKVLMMMKAAKLG